MGAALDHRVAERAVRRLCGPEQVGVLLRRRIDRRPRRSGRRRERRRSSRSPPSPPPAATATTTAAIAAAARSAAHDDRVDAPPAGLLLLLGLARKPLCAALPLSLLCGWTSASRLSTRHSKSCAVTSLAARRGRVARVTRNGSIDVDVAIVGAGMAGLSAALELERAGRSFVGARGARPCRRAARVAPARRTGCGSTSAASGSGPRRTACTRWRARTARRRSRPGPPGQNVVELSGRLTPLHGHDPEAAPARDGRRRPGDGAARPDGDEGAASRLPGTRRRRSSGTARRSGRGCATTWRRRAGREMMEIAVKGVWAAMPADVSLLHLLFYIASAGQLRPVARHRRRRAAGSLRRGCGQPRPRASQTASGSRCSTAPRYGGSSGRPTASG